MLLGIHHLFRQAHILLFCTYTILPPTPDLFILWALAVLFANVQC